MAEAFIYDAIRTPRGKGRSSGALHTVKPVDLVVGLIDELRRRHPNLDPQRIDDLLLGVVTPVGDQGGDIAVTAAIAAGLPDTVAGVQLNRFCASGLDAVNMAAQKVRSGWSSAVLAGGVESMSRVPMGTDGGALLFDPATAYDARAVMPGIAGDVCATLEAQSREDVDAFALRSQHRAAAAWSGGYFVKSVIPVRDRVGNVILEHDEHVRPGLTLEDLGKLKSSFDTIGDLAGFDASALQHFHWLEQVDHVHTPGNSSGIVDGAALMLVGNEEIGRDHGLTPRARIVSAAVTRSQPDFMLFGVFPATAKALAMAGLTVEDIDLFEINEAFASIVLKYQNDLNLPAEKVNVNGGAIAMGHPLGATGAMLLGTVLDELERRDLRRGLVTLCAAGGIGIATIVERI